MSSRRTPSRRRPQYIDVASPDCEPAMEDTFVSGTPTVAQTMAYYLEAVALSRSANTARTYRQGLQAFRRSLHGAGFDAATVEASRVSEDWIAAFARDLKRRSPATERLYLTAASGWYEYLAAEQLAEV